LIANSRTRSKDRHCTPPAPTDRAQWCKTHRFTHKPGYARTGRGDFPNPGRTEIMPPSGLLALVNSIPLVAFSSRRVLTCIVDTIRRCPPYHWKPPPPGRYFPVAPPESGDECLGVPDVGAHRFETRRPLAGSSRHLRESTEKNAAFCLATGRRCRPGR